MNLCFLTAQIATWPEKYTSRKGKLFTHFFIRVPNPKKGYPFFYIHASARQETALQLINWYARGDYILLEGRLRLSMHANKSYHLELSILRESPLVLEL